MNDLHFALCQYLKHSNFTGVAVLAAWIPARWAINVDAQVAL